MHRGLATKAATCAGAPPPTAPATARQVLVLQAAQQSAQRASDIGAPLPDRPPGQVGSCTCACITAHQTESCLHVHLEQVASVCLAWLARHAGPAQAAAAVSGPYLRAPVLGCKVPAVQGLPSGARGVPALASALQAPSAAYEALHLSTRRHVVWQVSRWSHLPALG